MIQKLIIYHCDSNDPYLNLAIEDNFLKSIKEDEMVIMTWVNRPSIVFGRFQNPILECKLDLCFKDDVKIVRRQSGGGCVYHDEGNLNFSFICPKKYHDPKKNHAFIQSILSYYGLETESTKRIDLKWEGKKFSGSAFKEKKDTAFHHGTLLFHSNLENLNNYLYSDLKLLETKSIASVRSKVVNLSELSKDLNLNVFVSKLEEHANRFYGKDIDVLTSALHDSDYLKHLRSNEWIYGETPKFKICFHNEDHEILLVFNKLKLIEIDFVSSSFHPGFVEEIKECLLNQSFLKFPISSFKALKEKNEFYISDVKKIERFLKSYFLMSDTATTT